MLFSIFLNKPLLIEMREPFRLSRDKVPAPLALSASDAVRPNWRVL